MPTVRLARSLAATVIAGGLLMSCGDDQGGGNAAPSSAATGSETAAPAFKVMVSGDFTSPVFATPESLAAATSVLGQIPGLGIVSCDTKGDPNAGQECERLAVDEKVIAVVNGFGVMAAGHEILNKANIPVLGVVQESVPNAFAVTSGIGNYVALGVGVAKAGCKKVATLYLDGGAGAALPDIIKSGAELNGAQEVARVPVVNNAPDLSAAVAKVLDADPECVVLSLPPTMVVQAVVALDQAGSDALLSGVNAIFGPETLETLGDLAEGILIPGVQLDPADDAPVIEEIREGMERVDENAEITSLAVSMWAGAKVLAAALDGVQGEPTPASTLTALNALRDVDVEGAIHDFSSIELTNPIVKRSFNHYAINYKIEDGKFARQGDFYDLAPALEQLKF